MALSTDKIDFLIDPVTNDLDVSGGRLHFSTGLQAVAQGVGIRVRMIRGEWFLNLLFGVPYLQGKTVTKDEALLGEKFDRAKAAAAFRAVIAAAPGVIDVLLADVKFNPSNRKASLSWRVRCAFGDTETQTVTVGV